MRVLEQHTVTIGKTNYLITAFDATYGLSVMVHLSKAAKEGDSPTPEFMKNVILKCVTANNVQVTEDWFNKHFSRNYEELYSLFEEITTFNFGKDEDPNEQGDTSE